MIISSKENPKIKEILKIRNNNSDKNSSWIFIEGEKLCREAVFSNITIQTLILSEKIYQKFDNTIIRAGKEVLVVSDKLFRILSEASNPQGVIAIVKSRIIEEDDYLKKPELLNISNFKLLICEDIQDPGNFGSIIRNADAFGFNGVVYSKNNVHPFNGKALQASMGSVFHIDLIYSIDIKSFLRKLKLFDFKVYATHLNGIEIDNNFKFDNKCGIILGNEGNGISEEISSESNILIKIPMTGKAQSLNVANASAIICFLTNQKMI